MKCGSSLLLAVVLALAACGGGGDSPGPAFPVPSPGSNTGIDSGPGNGSAGSDGSSGSAGAGGDGTGVAGGPGGVGSGGTGVGSDGTGVAAGGGDSGVGSGGTGVSSASASVGIGSVDGFGSIIVNGTRYDIRSAQLTLSDAAELKLGMTVRVAGPVSADQSTGTATRVISAPELRGRIAGLDPASGSFSLWSATVTTDSATVYDGVAGLAGLAQGDEVQVYGLPAAAGELRATRIEKVAEPMLPILTGQVQALDRGSRRFRIGALEVDYTTAMVDMGGPETALANGTIVRVPGNGLANGTYIASAVQWWQAPAVAEGSPLNLGGVVADYAGTSSFRVQGVTVNASAARVTGGTLGHGARVELAGLMRGGVLQATRVKVRQGSGSTGGNSGSDGGAAPMFSAEGTIGQFQSAASFKVQGQTIDASGPHVVFSNGSAQQLRQGQRVAVTGSRVTNGVLIADRVELRARGDDDDDDD